MVLEATPIELRPQKYTETITKNSWVHRERYGLNWESRVNEFLSTMQLALKFLKKPHNINDFFHLQEFVAFAEKTRKLASNIANKIVENESLWERLGTYKRAHALLFANWNQLSEDTQKRLSKEFGDYIVDDSITIIPASKVDDPYMESCGEMEYNMTDSRVRAIVGKRLMVKMRGTDAMISDRMIVTKKGNVILPYVWYYPDSYYVKKLNETRQNIREDGDMSNEIFFTMPDISLIALQVVRNSPRDEKDEGWDRGKHPLLFRSLREGEFNLTALFDKYYANK